MRNLPIDRNEAEWLVNLLEECDPKKSGTWRFDLASEIRTLFGMVSREEEARSTPPKPDPAGHSGSAAAPPRND